MVATRRIDIRVTKDQYEQVKLLAENAGYLTISAYIRARALNAWREPLTA